MIIWAVILIGFLIIFMMVSTVCYLVLAEAGDRRRMRTLADMVDSEIRDLMDDDA